MWRAIVVLTIGVTPVQAHCFRVWNYPTPQHCGGVYNRATKSKLYPIEVAPLPAREIPLPDLSGIWENNAPQITQDQLDHLKGIGLLRQYYETNTPSELQLSDQPLALPNQ